uniref:Uncharacterized protein n=1 Tax=Candidatus Kentrum sp. LPFa TaxID=2126335 RepID=A0A450XT88_9GAMM|nr:MAG: hypothetical protein BECKLPF1236A_GA0070988_101524 [Candidatus Kentron sp. LPFa]VFK32472.1 MAG: hypothetical protein BECKLPF1236C_GA0070990_101677 [Candidatus Kentron sp. LPFa]
MGQPTNRWFSVTVKINSGRRQAVLPRVRCPHCIRVSKSRVLSIAQSCLKTAPILSKVRAAAAWPLVNGLRLYHTGITGVVITSAINQTRRRIVPGIYLGSTGDLASLPMAPNKSNHATEWKE